MQPANGMPTPRDSLLRFRLPREGIYWLFAAAVLLLVSWLKAINLILLLAYLMLLFWGINFFLAGRRLSALQARRRLDDTVTAGTVSRAEIEVENCADAAQYGVRFVGRCNEQKQQWFAARLDPGQQFACAQTLHWPRRGRFVLPPLQAVSGYPFGLVQRSVELGEPREVLVLPAVGRLDVQRLRNFLSCASRGDQWEQHVARRLPTGMAELHAIRPYQPGDSPRWVHWRTTARRAELMVREFEEETSENLLVVVDPWRPQAHDNPQLPTRSEGDGASTFEDVVSLAATICCDLQRERGLRLTLIIAGPDPVLVPDASSPTGTRRSLESLAAVESCPEYSHCALLDTLDGLPESPLLVLGVEPEGLLRSLSGAHVRPAAVLRAADLDRYDFYEKPHAR
ncbi:MAG: DUF58 domain-containing protein [Planctomycetia bacterium]|nr:DUF58 domain-containing protein [Planctomycetia bacterium]